MSLNVSNIYFPIKKNESAAGNWWLTPVIIATQETEIRRIMV
jgi:hypothetical protein